MPVRLALLSVWDKQGLVDFARGLRDRGVRLLASGGTARALTEAGVEVRDLSAWTGTGSLAGGRVKTLHPAVAAAILARLPQDTADLESLGVEPVDLVAVNLYPFARGLEQGEREERQIELIDVGGPTLLRAAAKNHARVACLCRPTQYSEILRAMDQHGGDVPAGLRRTLAGEAFALTAAYDADVAGWLAGGETRRPDDLARDPGLPPPAWNPALHRACTLRYGENPHQAAALYLPAGAEDAQLEALSWNNLLDLDAAWHAASDLARTGGGVAAVVVKHAAPCGAALRPNVAEAVAAALACDPQSAYGGVVGLSVALDETAAEALVVAPFLEGIAAASLEPGAVARLRARKGWGARVRLVAAPRPESPQDRHLEHLDLRSFAWGLGVQVRDHGEPAGEGPEQWTQVSGAEADAAIAADLSLDLDVAWRLARHLKSNAVALVRQGAAVGLGGGFPNRVDAARRAVACAGERAAGAVAASDGFFPFADGLEALAEAGVRAVVQPGGSKRDAEVIAAAQRLGVAMWFTGRRAFRH